MGSNFFEFEFHNGTTVSMKGSGLNFPASIHSSPSGMIHLEVSAMLNCTVHTGICVYCTVEEGSFRTSGKSESGLIYATGARNTKYNNKKASFHDLKV